MQTSIEVKGNSIVIVGPFSYANNDVWRKLGGKFSSGAWVVPDNDTSRNTVAELFGAKSDIVEALVPYEAVVEDRGIAQVGGYVLAQRRGRDNPVRLAAGVSLENGCFASRGGSVRNPSVALDRDVVFRLCCRDSFAKARGLGIVSDSPRQPKTEI